VAVTAAPGPSAVTTALAVSGLPCDRFCFEGFLPRKPGERRSRLAGLAGEERTLVLFEAPHRLRETLVDLAAAFGPDRAGVVCRELTKLFETFYRGPLGELAADPQLDAPKGEIVILVGPGRETEASAADADAALSEALSRLKPADAAGEVAKALGLPRRDLYRRALELKR